MPISKPDSDPADSSHATSSAAWSTVKRLYQQAVELSGAARETFIAGAEVDEAIRAEVRSLLAYSPDATGQGSAGFLSAPAAIEVLGRTEHMGEPLGPWRIVRALDAGLSNDGLPLTGDLDDVLQKTLEKSAQRRYASVDALAADIRAYLAGYPVSAHATRWCYVAGKFLLRHRWGAVLGGVAIIALCRLAALK